MYLFNLFAGVILLITINELRHGSCQSFAFSVETVCGAGYTTQCTLTYDGTDYGWNNVDACSSKHQYVPHGSSGIQFVCKAALGETIFDLSNFEPLNTNWCFRVWGTTYGTSWEYDDCNSLGYTEMPTKQPTLMPTNPSMSPTNNPTIKPSAFPTNNPTNNPSFNPSSMPTLMPSSVPSMLPSIVPTYIPSNVPSLVPSNHPSQIPTYIPSNIPSNAPTAATNMPSYIPTAVTTMETIESETSNEQEHGTTSAHNSSYIENSDSSSQDSEGNNNQSLTFVETILSDIVYISIIVSVLLVCILICIYVFYWKKKIKYDSNKNSLSKVNILEMDGKELDKDGKATETRETYTVNIQITKGGSEKEESGEKNDDVALNEEEGKGNGRNKRIDSDGSSLFEKPNQQDKINMQRLISLSQTKSTEGMQSVHVLVTPKGHTNGYLDDMDMEIDDNDNDKPKINVNSEDSESGEELYHNQVATPVSINSPSPDANDNDDHVADTPIDMLATPQ